MSDTSNQQDTQQEPQQDTGDQSQSKPEGQDFASNNNNQSSESNNNNENSENTGESTAKKQTKKIENPDSIPSAGGKQIGADHKGESKMLGENARSESVIAGGDADAIQKQLEGKKVDDKKGNDGGEEEKKGMMEKAKEKMGMGHKE